MVENFCCEKHYVFPEAMFSDQYVGGDIVLIGVCHEKKSYLDKEQTWWVEVSGSMFNERTNKASKKLEANKSDGYDYIQSPTPTEISICKGGYTVRTSLIRLLCDLSLFKMFLAHFHYDLHADVQVLYKLRKLCNFLSWQTKSSCNLCSKSLVYIK